MADFILTWLPTAIILVVSFIFMAMMKSTPFGKGRQHDELKFSKDYATDYSRILHFYEFLARFPLTSKSANELRELVAGLSIYTVVEQRVEVARLLGMSYVQIISILSVVLVLTDGNMVMSVASVVLMFAFRRDSVNKKLKKTRLQFWKDLEVTFVSLQSEYQRMKNLDLAFQFCRTTKKTRFVLSQVEQILQSDNKEAALERFNQNTTYEVLQRFSYLCYASAEFGVAHVEKEGTNTFITGMDQLITSLKTDIDLLTEEKNKFYKIEKLPLVGLALSFYMPVFMQNNIPGLRFFYEDGVGFLISVLVVLTIIGAYLFTIRINDKDRTYVDIALHEIRWLENPKFRQYWGRVVGEKQRGAYEKQIRESLSHLKPEILQVRKTIYAIVFFVFVLAVISMYINIERTNIRENHRNIPEEITYTLSQWHEDHHFVFRQVVTDPDANYYEVRTMLGQQGWVLSQEQLDIVALELMNSNARLQTTLLTPLHAIIAFLFGIVGFHVPHLLLHRRKIMVVNEAKMEIMLLQSIVVQLMHTPLKLKDYLIFFAAISKLYKFTHLFSYVRQFNHPEDLKQLNAAMPNTDYYNLMENLYSLHSDMTPMEVFRETENNRKYLFTLHTKQRHEIQVRNLTLCKVVLNVALAAPIILQVVVPLAMFAMESLVQYAGMIPG